MSENEMRKQVNSAYNNAPKWVDKTKKMTSSQIQAIWFRFKKEGIIK